MLLLPVSLLRDSGRRCRLELDWTNGGRGVKRSEVLCQRVRRTDAFGVDELSVRSFLFFFSRRLVSSSLKRRNNMYTRSSLFLFVARLRGRDEGKEMSERLTKLSSFDLPFVSFSLHLLPISAARSRFRSRIRRELHLVRIRNINHPNIFGRSPPDDSLPSLRLQRP